MSSVNNKVEEIFALIEKLSPDEEEILRTSLLGRREFPFGVTMAERKMELKKAFPLGGKLTEKYDPETMEYSWTFDEKKQ